MQVILVNDVEKLGRAGDIVRVAPGYARNYLLPKRIALEANVKNQRWIEQQKTRILKRAQELRTDAEAVAARIASVSVVIAKQAGEEDKLYGSVTSTEIAEKLAAHGIEIDKRKIVLHEPIRRLGDHDVAIKLHSDVEAQVKVQVVRTGEETPEA